ncbi:MAG: class I SAM-dependent methyltransferase [Spirochaetota bacterium]|nr:class I SAM-dependent methyltransferase [Spirochaetota bacterium]
MMIYDNNYHKYLDGKKLYGDDFDLVDIENWFKDEEKGYFKLVSKDEKKYQYCYHALNYRKGYRFLPRRHFSHVLGIGSAYGDEFIQISKFVDQFTILEPSQGFVTKDINDVKVDYVKPRIDGKFPFPNNSFDLITCFGTLHHIPNVSKIVNEIHRCLKKDGYALIREPIVSMGDWNKPRKGLTKRERGIPLSLFRNMIISVGFEIIKEQMCMFSLTNRLTYITKRPVYNSTFVILLDNVLCWLFTWNYIYHANNSLKKIRPTSVFYILHKK